MHPFMCKCCQRTARNWLLSGGCNAPLHSAMSDTIILTVPATGKNMKMPNQSKFTTASVVTKRMCIVSLSSYYVVIIAYIGNIGIYLVLNLLNGSLAILSLLFIAVFFFLNIITQTCQIYIAASRRNTNKGEREKKKRELLLQQSSWRCEGKDGRLVGCCIVTLSKKCTTKEHTCAL